MFGNFVGIIFLLILIVITCAFGLVIHRACHIKASPDKVVIITGGRELRTLQGKSGYYNPIRERYDTLSLKAMRISIETENYVPTNDYIDLKVKGNVTAKISDNPNMIGIAAQTFLNEDDDMIVTMLREILEGNTREIIGTMKLKDLVTDREAFAEKVKQSAIPDLAKLGIEIITFNVQDFSDRDGIIADLGADNTAAIKKDAAISRAEADKEIAIAKARSDKQATEAEIDSKTYIAEQQNQLAIRQAKLLEEENIAKANAESAYSIKSEENRKNIETATADANEEKARRDIEIRKNEVQAAEYVEIDKEKYRKMQEAESKVIEAQNEAKAIREKADATAYAIRIEGEAKATAILKEAEAMQHYSYASIIKDVLAADVQKANSVREGLSKIDKITMYGEGNQAKLVNEITSTTDQLNQGALEALGLDLKGLLEKINTRHYTLTNDQKDVNPVVADLIKEDLSPKITPDSQIPTSK